MFGYIVCKKFDESRVWDYASVTVYEETGFELKRHRGKVFLKDIMDDLKDLSLGDQVEFEVAYTERGSRKYTEFTTLKYAPFKECNKCYRRSHDGGCNGSGAEDSERLEGVSWTRKPSLFVRYSIISSSLKDPL